MRTQHVRLYINKQTGKIQHIYTQDTPISIDVTPISSRGEYDIKDYCIHVDDGEHVNASVLISELELDGGRLCIKEDKPKDSRLFTLRKTLQGIEVQRIADTRKFKFIGGVEQPHTPKEK